MLAKQAQQKSQHDRRAQHREFFVGQTVMARNLRPGPDWVPTVVVERLGLLTYLVETSNKLLWKRHIDLLRELSMRNSNTEPQEDTSPNDLEPEVCSTPTIAIQPGEPATQTTHLEMNLQPLKKHLNYPLYLAGCPNQFLWKQLELLQKLLHPPNIGTQLEIANLQTD